LKKISTGGASGEACKACARAIVAGGGGSASVTVELLSLSQAARTRKSDRIASMENLCMLRTPIDVALKNQS
jgi:hypothetical protein